LIGSAAGQAAKTALQGRGWTADARYRMCGLARTDVAGIVVLSLQSASFACVANLRSYPTQEQNGIVTVRFSNVKDT
jgi:hypothetical protein